MNRPLEDLTAIVTGASSGIGRATASLLAQSGARVFLIGRRQAVLEDVAAACGSLASAYPCDLTDDEQLRTLVTRIRAATAKLDILVHSSGIIKLGPTQDAPLVDFDEQYAANVRAPYLLTQSLIPMLRASRGQVVFVNSSVTRAANIAGRGTYAASQQSLHSIANALRDEVNELGIRVTNVFPGTTATDRQIKLHAMSGRRYDADRMLQPEDVAQAVLFALTIGRTAEVTDIHLRPMLKPLP